MQSHYSAFTAHLKVMDRQKKHIHTPDGNQTPAAQSATNRFKTEISAFQGTFNTHLEAHIILALTALD